MKEREAMTQVLREAGINESLIQQAIEQTVAERGPLEEEIPPGKEQARINWYRQDLRNAGLLN